MDAKVELPVTEKAKLSIRNLNFYYGAFHALKNINLDIPEGKVTAFIGPSGCGKSTLLRTFNRMYALYPEQRAQGEIILDGENILESRLDVSLIRAKVGMVFQKPTPFPMSIYDNIAFGVRLFETLPRVEMGSSAEQGSSSRSTSGFIAIPRAMHRRCCCPPESAIPLCFSLSFASPHMAALVSAHSTRSSISRRGKVSKRRTPKAMLS